ncbi:3-oxoacyl-[acyl-carrier-protein] synthase III C-terminal domain-containing protein [uncultured Agrococcus sp.]|uniref:3-oxoacyl-ACP synthase III family protein n=1 Tax=uncultured Agrococcus sp. TaxID=382258 RepID=UPI0025F881CB|nr:3-oxoacyl-[acyl-carrier-protein] synthase III C-terminal domain-containing protein [uncultured Agrococcus sp.]
MAGAITSQHARIASVGIHLPSAVRTTQETELLLRAANPGMQLPTGLIHRITGVRRVHVRERGQDASDLAALAGRKALAACGEPVDHLIFASASQDMIEPATSHIVAEKLGLGVPVFDAKNACNSVLNGMQIAAGLIAIGQARRVLVASGETPTTAARWELADKQQFLRSFPGFTMSDGGAAVVVEASDEPGIEGMYFAAESRHWQIGTLPTGGSHRPRDLEATYFDMDGAKLAEAFLQLGPGPVFELLDRLDARIEDFDLIAMHQVATPHLPRIAERLGVSAERIIETVSEHGNLASVTLPLQLSLAFERGAVRQGSRVLLIGLAGGISIGVMAVRL